MTLLSQVLGDPAPYINLAPRQFSYKCSFIYNHMTNII